MPLGISLASEVPCRHWGPTRGPPQETGSGRRFAHSSFLPGMSLQPFRGVLGGVLALFSVGEGQESPAIGSPGLVSLDDRSEEVDHGLRLVSEEGGVILPV